MKPTVESEGMNMAKMKIQALFGGTIIYLSVSGVAAFNVSEGNYGIATFCFMCNLWLLLHLVFFVYKDSR